MPADIAIEAAADQDAKTTLALRVSKITREAQDVASFELVDPLGLELPRFAAGAHLDVRINDNIRRQYSLCNDPQERHRYVIAVLNEPAGRGGSRWMHEEIAVDSVLLVSPPRNHFPLAGREALFHLLLAGGIGVTPVLSMAAALSAGQRPFRFIYAGRSRDQLAFLGEGEALCREHLTIHTDDTSGIFDVKGLMASLAADEPLYLCGPKPMIDTAIQSAKDLGWADGRLRFEIFTTATPVAGDQSFEVVLNNSGKTFKIPPDKTILAVLIEAGEDPMHDCQRGDCGICQVGVIEGTPDHRDYILTDAEKTAGKVMQICVSRSKSPRLVLDL